MDDKHSEHDDGDEHDDENLDEEEIDDLSDPEPEELRKYLPSGGPTDGPAPVP